MGREGEKQRKWKWDIFSLMLRFWFFLNTLVSQPQLVELTRKTRGSELQQSSLMAFPLA